MVGSTLKIVYARGRRRDVRCEWIPVPVVVSR